MMIVDRLPNAMPSARATRPPRVRVKPTANGLFRLAQRCRAARGGRPRRESSGASEEASVGAGTSAGEAAVEGGSAVILTL